MIVLIVLVIVTAVQVNSQELCPSVCECNGDNATCANLFSDVTGVTQHRFHSALNVLAVTGRSRLELEEDFFLRWNITSLIVLDLSRNNITNIWQRAFYSLAYLEELYLSGNSITTLHTQTFYYNTRLVWLSLENNSITDIHRSTFQNNDRLGYILMSGNKITLLDPDLFKNNLELMWIHLATNRICDVHPSTFRNNRKLNHLFMSGNKINSIHPDTFIYNTELKWLELDGKNIIYINSLTFENNSQLRSLDISRNKITLINPDTFIHNKKLRCLYLQGNNIIEINNNLFTGLEQLEKLDLSNNNIEELTSLLFHNTLAKKNQQNHKVSNLKHLNLAQNMIRSFNFVLYFPSSSNSDTFNPAFQHEYLNLSSNQLTTLDVTSVKWLNGTTAVTDLTENLWNCDCSVLLEVWRELKHKQTLHCASPRELHGKTWDVLEGFCFLVAEDMNDKSKANPETASPNTECTEESGVNPNKGGPSEITTILIVTGVVLVCAVGGGLILVKVVKFPRFQFGTLISINNVTLCVVIISCLSMLNQCVNLFYR